MKKKSLWADQDTAENKKVCEMLHTEDLITTSDWVIDITHFNTYVSTNKKKGYVIWATPLTKLMKKHSSLKKLVSHLAQWRIEKIKYDQGLRSQPHWLGLLIAQPLFFIFCSLAYWVQKIVTSLSYLKKTRYLKSLT